MHAYRNKTLKRAYELARLMANERSPASTAMIRHMMYRNSGLAHPLHAHKVESLAMFHVSQHDGREGVVAFNAKRPPCFTEAGSVMDRFRNWWKIS